MTGYNAGEGTGSAKAMAKQTTSLSGKKGTTVYEGRDNEKGQSQADIVNMRSKNRTDYDDAVDAFKNKDGELQLTDKQYKGYQKNFQALKDAQTFSTDSINTVNTNIQLKKAKKNKKADDSGLFMRSSNKQVGPRNKKGDFVKTHNKAAADPGPEITTTVSGKLPEGVYIGKDGELKNKEGYNYNLKGGNKKNFESIRRK